MGNSGGIFHIDADGVLSPMSVAGYVTEDEIQALLETHPDLLAGGHMTPDNPRRWLLIQREQGIADRQDGSDRWSIDHLFVDQDAIPTLVEVKRRGDTRIRREVVGQMLDYAANAVRYWRIDALRASFEAAQERAGLDPEEALVELTADGASIDEFFAMVDANLRAGRIRMVFVADEIPDELKAIVEFLNEQMRPAEVLAVEVKRYGTTEPGIQVIVPSVYGRTSVAAAKSTGGHPRADRATLLTGAAPRTQELADRLSQFANEHSFLWSETRVGWQMRTAMGALLTSLVLFNTNVYIPLNEADTSHQTKLTDLADRFTAITSRPTVPKQPWASVPEVLDHWQVFVQILEDFAEIRLS